MWLEELAWFWAPVVGGMGLWLVRRVLHLSAEVHGLHRRIEKLERTSAAQGQNQSKAA